MSADHLREIPEDTLWDLLEYYRAFAKDETKSLPARRLARIETIHIADSLGWTVWDAPATVTGMSKYLEEAWAS